MFKKLSILLNLLALPLSAEEPLIEQQIMDAIAASPEVKAAGEFEHFTGKIAKGKVRLRTTPTVDGVIVQELQKGDLLLVDGEHDSFFQVKAPPQVKGYVFRTFILDGKVEGSRVNVRLYPDLEAPVIAQLNSGDTVDGQIFSGNTKWIECTPPESVRFYVASEYVEKVGDQYYIVQCQERQQQSEALLSAAMEQTQAEFAKGYDEMNIESIVATCQTILDEYADCQEIAGRAKELMAQVNSDYLAKKIAHLEGRAKDADLLAAKLQELGPSLNEIDPKAGLSPFPLKLTSWQDVEQNYIAAFKKQHLHGTEEEFYHLEKQKAITLSGILTPYLRPVKNKPGDYLLLDPTDNHPLAYLYSTKINLQEELGKIIEIVAAPRPNNHFAYPAYYVLAVEEK
jgi:hypothetical protein